VFLVGLSGLGNDVGNRSLALRRIRRSISHLSKPVKASRSMSSRITSRTIGTKGGRPILRLSDSAGATGGIRSGDWGPSWTIGSFDGSGSLCSGSSADSHSPGLAADLQSLAPLALCLEVLAALGL
jgi:hypothetical protein